MGLRNTSSRSTIVSIIGGKFTVRLADDSDDPNAVERELEKGPNKGKVVKELKYTALDGLITGARIHSGDYGDDLLLDMTDEGDEFTLQVPVESMYFGQIAKRMPNIDASLPILFGMGYDKERQTPFLFIKQNGESVHMKFTKAEPHDMPQPTKRKVQGKDKWDFTEQDNFLYEIACSWIYELNDTLAGVPDFVSDED